ncbi:MAG TPA: amidophosphoribosyltransferase [Chloroflexota bacterium]|nr:amidophosphoribosyltransferase [Chloroflexota bacterium]HZU04504.1 amidophosphoribosyltransferase [Chloroflexota bacterium]
MPGAESLHEACGIFGIYGPGEDVARLTFFGLYALQHRGQESAGIATADGERLYVYRDMGLVSQVFTEEHLEGLRGHIAVGHTRYSTTGASRLENAQPIVVESDVGPLAVAHNGNLVNTPELLTELERRGQEQRATTTDSELIALLAASTAGTDWPARIRAIVPLLQGAFSLVMASPTQLIGLRDPLGVRPLVLGRLDRGWVIASETCALDTIGATTLRDIEPGEMVVIDAEGVRTEQVATVTRRALCVFEFIYFARPDSVIDQREVYLARERMGRALAREHPAEADVVIAVPDASVPAAIGYARESGIPFHEGLIKNRYIGRTFIQPDQRLRERGVQLKFNPLRHVLEGQRVVVVDDSIVRGTTTPRVISMLRKAGAREVHMRISAPPMRHPCYLGVDTARREELIAAQIEDVAEIGRAIGADSLGYLSLEGLLWAVGLPADRLCSACFTGDYPLRVSAEADKHLLEIR